MKPGLIFGSSLTFATDLEKKNWNKLPMNMHVIFLHVIHPDLSSSGDLSVVGCVPDGRTAIEFCKYWNTQDKGCYYSHMKIRRMDAFWKTPKSKRKKT